MKKEEDGYTNSTFESNQDRYQDSVSSLFSEPSENITEAGANPENRESEMNDLCLNYQH